jgi:alkylhydroperoxidase family enzyme
VARELQLRPERLALEAAEGMTITGRDVSDELFAVLREEFTEDELVELAATIALENCRSKFNHFFRVEANGFCRWEPSGQGPAQARHDREGMAKRR